MAVLVYWYLLNILLSFICMLCNCLSIAQYNLFCVCGLTEWNIIKLAASETLQFSFNLCIQYVGVCVPHSCSCGQDVDAWGQHAFVCKRAPGRTPRHQALNEVIARCFASAGIPVSKEPTGIYRDSVKTTGWSHLSAIAVRPGHGLGCYGGDHTGGILPPSFICYCSSSSWGCSFQEGSQIL